MILSPQLYRPITIYHILEAQEHIATHLENTAQFERPRNLARGCEEPEHLHEIACEPGSKDRDAEAFARARAVVGKDLGEREGSFDREAEIAD
jgi:hypothetical protein